MAGAARSAMLVSGQTTGRDNGRPTHDGCREVSTRARPRRETAMVSTTPGANGAATAANGHARPLPAGTPAPDFSLHSTPDQKVALSEFRGQPVILAFYPADWS